MVIVNIDKSSRREEVMGVSGLPPTDKRNLRSMTRQFYQRSPSAAEPAYHVGQSIDTAVKKGSKSGMVYP